MKLPSSSSAVAEREELALVVGDLSRTPRLSKLLQFLGDRYLEGRIDEITEYSIATEVFGRSKTTFDCATDSIARVELHRLRKRLKEYYLTEGRDHSLVITIPQRTYILEFNPRPDPDPDSGATSSSLVPGELTSLPAPTMQNGLDTPNERENGEDGLRQVPLASGRRLGYAAPVAVLAVLALALIGYYMRSKARNAAQTAAAIVPSEVQQPTPADAAQVPLRLLCGYEGSPRIDSTGAYWQADKYFHGGAAYQRPSGEIEATSDPMIFAHGRAGDFSYDIPVPPGPYELHLFFVSSQPEAVNPGTFHVDANWKLILPSFNISSDALGANIAEERVFRDIYPTKWGIIHLGFTTETGAPSLSAIELLPALRHKQLPIRIVMQKTAITDNEGKVWHPDTYFEGGRLDEIPRHITGTSDPNVYAMERYGHFKYVIPVDARDRYTLILHFAEMFWGPQSSGQGGVGSRVFRVYCNGDTLLDNLDIYKEAGGLHALTKTFYHLRPSPEGKLNLTFEPVANFATISAIEVIDESQ